MELLHYSFRMPTISSLSASTSVAATPSRDGLHRRKNVVKYRLQDSLREGTRPADTANTYPCYTGLPDLPDFTLLR